MRGLLDLFVIAGGNLVQIAFRHGDHDCPDAVLRRGADIGVGYDLPQPVSVRIKAGGADGQGGIRLYKNVQRGAVSGRATGRDRAVRRVADCGAFGQSCGQRQRKGQRPGVQSAPDRENRLGAGRLRSRLGSGPGRRIGRCRIVRRGALRVRRSIRAGTGRAGGAVANGAVAGGAVAGGSPASGQHEASAHQQQCEQEG